MTKQEIKKFYLESAEWHKKQIVFETHQIEYLNRQMHREKEYYGCETGEYHKCKKERSQRYYKRKQHKAKAEMYIKLAENY